MIKIGIQTHPQHCSLDELRSAWRAADEMGVDSIWTWDHFYPLYGEPDGNHFEGYTLLAAMACDTTRASIGLMVGCNSYRNPNLVADMVRTIDHLSDGRTYLGIGSGWFKRDYDEYGYDFKTAGQRLADLAESLPIIKDRLAKLVPPPVGSVPILVGGGGERKTLRLVARYADAWNTFGPPETYAHKNAVLNEWCEKEGRDPLEIERTVVLETSREIERFDEYVEAGATHLILNTRTPFDLGPVKTLLDLARK